MLSYPINRGCDCDILAMSADEGRFPSAFHEQTDENYIPSRHWEKKRKRYLHMNVVGSTPALSILLTAPCARAFRGFIYRLTVYFAGGL